MKAIVDIRLAGGAAVIVLDGVAQRLATVLHGKRNDGGGAAEQGRQAARAKIVGHDGATRGKALGARLVEVAMRIYAPGKNEPAGRIQRLFSVREMIGKGRNTAVAYAHIATHDVTGRGHGAATDDQVKVAQAANSSPRCAQKVIRRSMAANKAYMIMPITEVTISPANTSGVSKLEVAAIIR